jgi:uncharacterized protein
MQMTIDVPGHGSTSAVVYRAAGERRVGATFVFAHGAGAGQQSGFMTTFAADLASRGLDVVTFNFLYVEQHRKVPDRTDRLEACFQAVIAAARDDVAGNAILIGGKSMGGRIASHLAAREDNSARGLILLGYPLHPPGKPDQLRVAHLAAIAIPVLCLQGSRDPFGSPGELRPHLARIQGNVTLHEVEHGDHSLAPSRNKSVIEQTYGALQDLIVRWAAQTLQV